MHWTPLLALLLALPVLASPTLFTYMSPESEHDPRSTYQLDQHGHVVSALGQGVDGADHVFQRHALLAQRLCALGFIPDVRLFQLGVDLF